MEQPQETRFDGWRVRWSSGELSRDGTVHRLQDQPLAVLQELLRVPGEVVTREQLIARLWPKGVVDFDTSLNTAVRKLRVALRDDADTPHYIETLPRRGYRFIGQVELPTPVAFAPIAAQPAETVPTAPPAASAVAPIWRQWKSLALGTALLLGAALVVIAPRLQQAASKPPAPAPTVVVLPLVDMSTAQGDQSMCDGLTEELSSWLSHVPTLKVIARTSAFAFKGRNLDVRTIARTLGATHVIEGSLRRAGASVRVTIQLINGADGLHLWSRTFDLQPKSIFQLEDLVARQVAESLNLRVNARTMSQWASRQPAIVDAFDLYLLGRYHQRKRTSTDNQLAIGYFRRAVTADPQFSLAPVGLAETLLNDLHLNGRSLVESEKEIEALLDQSLTQNPELTDALAAKGWLRTEQFRLDEAEKLLARAVELNPNDAASERYLAAVFEQKADPRAALEHYSRSTALDPLDFIVHVNRCLLLQDLGRPGEAAQACERARQLEPGNVWGALATAWLARSRGDTAKALSWMTAAHKLAPTDLAIADQLVDLLLGKADYASARELYSSLASMTRSQKWLREGNVRFAESGAVALDHYLASVNMGDMQSADELVELALLFINAGNPTRARDLLRQAQALSTYAAADLLDPSQIRQGYSLSLIFAASELNGGDRAAATRMLRNLNALLEQFERNGGQHFGLYTLRAESLALLGEPDAAMKALARAAELGWKSTWHARQEPFLASLQGREDFKALLARIDSSRQPPARNP